MAASSKLHMNSLSMDDDGVKKPAGSWGFVHFFFVLAVVLCVLLYAPRVLVLAPYGADFFVAPASSPPSLLEIATPSSSTSRPSSVVTATTRARPQHAVADERHDGEHTDRQTTPIVLDNQVGSPCASMREDSICCDRSDFNTDVCFMSGHVRTHAASLSLLLSPPANQTAAQTNLTAEEERVRPYTRKWERLIMDKVQEVRLRPARPDEVAAGDRDHHCDVVHDAPLLVMTAGGYTGNFFHAFSDGLVPAWVTAQHLRRRVVLGVLEYNPWWAAQFREVIAALSAHPVVDLLHDKRTHCFPAGAIVGTRFHGVLTVDPARLRDNRTVVDFHNFLAGAYSQRSNPPPPETKKTTTTTEQKPRWRPRLGIVSRKGTRVIENQAAVARLASSIGFDVAILATANGAPLSDVYAAVSACDVLVGVHGADLTRFLFLRPGSALVQIAPLGLGPVARGCFGDPAPRMGLRYEQYEVRAGESSLSRRYAADDPVVADPEKAVRAPGGGWGLVARVYLGGQNVSLDLGRFGQTLARLHKRAVLIQRRQQRPTMA